MRNTGVEDGWFWQQYGRWIAWEEEVWVRRPNKKSIAIAQMGDDESLS